MIRRSLLPLLLLALLAVPAGAQASAKSDQIINQCANESLSGSYSQKDYEQALQDLPADLKEYTDCADVIRSAQRNAATSSGGTANPRSVAGGGGSGSGSGPTTGAPGAAGVAPPVATAAGGAPAASSGAAAPAPAAAAPAPATDPGAAADQAALNAAQAAGAGAVNIGGTSLTPGVPAGAALSLSDLPTPMLVLLGLFVLIALLGVGAMVKSWVLGLGRSRDAADPS